MPFYIAAPLSTVDPETPDGASIPIELRADDEVREVQGRTVGPQGAPAQNRAFDVTPASLIAGWVTEAGVFRDAAALAAARSHL